MIQRYQCYQLALHGRIVQHQFISLSHIHSTVIQDHFIHCALEDSQMPSCIYKIGIYLHNWVSTYDFLRWWVSVVRKETCTCYNCQIETAGHYWYERRLSSNYQLPAIAQAQTRQVAIGFKNTLDKDMQRPKANPALQKLSMQR
jgi:hypothetical protein